MKKTWVSKLSFVIHPTYLLIIFSLGLIAGSQLTYPILYLAFFLSISALVLIFLKYKFAALLLFLAVGIVFGFNAQKNINKEAVRKCTEGQIVSSGRKFKNNFLYKINSNKQIFLIKTDNDELEVRDRISYCLGDKVSLTLSDSSYLLSQLKNKQVYETTDVKIVEEGKGFLNAISRTSKTIRIFSNNLFVGDQGALAYGIIFGSKGEFSNDFKNDLKRSGTSHLVAVSGYNVSIITSWLFEALRTISKNFSGIASSIILLLFYFLTGGAASILRAAIMGIIILLSKFIGRKVLPLHLLSLAGAVILLLNPFAIFDWGFQLSFMATAGLFFLSGAIQKMIENKIHFNQDLTKIFSETLAAQFFVLPILISNFGQFSLIAPLTNLLILPLVPLLMCLVFLSILLYFIYPPVGLLFAGFSKILLTYVMSVINFSADIPFASVNFRLPTYVGLIAGYIIVILTTYFLRKKFDSKTFQ